MRPEQLCSSGPKSSNTLAYLLDALVFPSLRSQASALKHCPHSHKKRKFLLVCEGYASFGLHGHCLEFPPALRQLSGPDQCKSQAKGVLALLHLQSILGQ
jgi:hypothetical protein